MVATLDAPVPVRGSEREGVHGGPLDRIRDDACRHLGEMPQAPLLPGGNEWAHRAEISDGGARGGEREAAAGTFQAARDWPCCWRSAARTAGALQQWELGEAQGANRLAEAAANHAPTWKQEIEEHIGPTVRGESARMGAGCVPRVCRG